MPCCLGALALMIPRVTLIGMLLMGYGPRAFDTVLWPVLGFFFMPYTTCVYAIGINEAGGFYGWSLILLIVGVLFDFTSYGGASQTRVRYGSHYYYRR